MKVTLDQQIAEVKRELAMRKQVYPRRIEKGLMKQAEADWQIATLKAVLETLRTLQPMQQKTIFEIQHES